MAGKGPRSPMVVDQGFTLARPNAKTRARSLYSKSGKVLALTGALVQLLSRHVRATSDISTAKRICTQPMSFGQGKMVLTLQSTNYVLTKLFNCRTAYTNVPS